MRTTDKKKKKIMLVITLLLVLAVLAALWRYSKGRHNYWASKGIISAPAIPLVGHFHRMLMNKPWEVVNMVSLFLQAILALGFNYISHVTRIYGAGILEKKGHMLYCSSSHLIYLLIFFAGLQEV